jgi:hypothetical protein
MTQNYRQAKENAATFFSMFKSKEEKELSLLVTG